MKITDKMIEDIRIIMNNTKPSEMTNINYMKEQLKQKGYEVEEEKSYLEQARAIELRVVSNYEHCPEYYKVKDVDKKIELYEKAIVEMQKIYQETIQNYIDESKEMFKKQLKIDGDLIEWLMFLRDFNTYEFNYFDGIPFNKLAERLLKQL